MRAAIRDEDCELDGSLCLGMDLGGYADGNPSGAAGIIRTHSSARWFARRSISFQRRISVSVS